MNKFVFSIIAVFVSLNAAANPKHSSKHIHSSSPLSRSAVTVSLDQVVRRVSNQDLTIQANAQKVYQAKQSIAVARGNLLPKLNIWRILTAPFSLGGALGLVEDIAPFLIPGNWFQYKAQKLFYESEREGYRGLRANEILTAKATYIHLVYDQSLLADIETSRSEIQETLEFVKKQEDVGMVPQGSSAEIEIRYLALAEDARSVKMLVSEEATLLGVMMGYKGGTKIQVAPLALPNPSQSPSLRFSDFESKVVSASPELRQYHYLIYASQYVKKEARFSILGLGTLSQGVAGGIFDNVPKQDGLGFGTSASIAVSKAQTRQLELQKQGATEMLRRQLQITIDNYNLDIENYSGVVQRAALSEQIHEQITHRLELGEVVPTRDIVEASRNRIQAISSRSEVRARFLISQDKINRMAMRKDYDDSSKSVPIERH